MRAVCSVVALVVLAGPAGTAGAQDAEAERHFQQGLRLSDEGSYAAALAEFEAAYRLAPESRTLFNLGLVYAELGRPVEAVDRLERFLGEGGRGIDRARRAHATRLLEEQRRRIGRLRVRVNVDGATVSVDGVDVATSPLPAPIPVAAGDHVVGAEAPGHGGRRVSVQVAGQSDVDVDLVLERFVGGSLRVRSALRDVEVEIDGRSIGRTPFRGTVPVDPGPRRVVGRRAGYLDATVTVEVALGAESEVELELEPDPDAPAAAVGRLRLELPDEETTITVDGRGQEIRSGGIALPSGDHLLRVEVADRLPYEERITIEAGATLSLDPDLEWTADARRDLTIGESRRRLIGALFASIGAATAAASIGLLIWNAGRDDGPARRYNECIEGGGICDPPGDQLRQDLLDVRDKQGFVRAGGGSMLGVGIGAAAVGLFLYFSSVSDDEIDAAARATVRPSLLAGPRAVMLSLGGSL